MKTRSKPPNKENQETTIAGPVLGPGDKNPGKLFVLPNRLSQDARLLTLQNPASGKPNRYLYCPENGFFEFTNIAAMGNSPKSWLVVKDRTEESAKGGQQHATQQWDDLESNCDDYITANGDMLIATPYDALFFLLPALHQKSRASEDKLYLSLDDYADELGGNSNALRTSLQSAMVRDALEKRLHAVCDIVDTGEEKMYRLSRQKLVRELVERAQNLSRGKLPTSMENRFVRQPLESPVMGFSSSKAKDSTEGEEITSAEDPEERDGQLPETATAVDENLASLLRVRVAFDFMVNSYLPAELRFQVKDVLATNEYLDFSKLNQYMERLKSLRSEALTLRSMSDNISRKRGLNDDDEAVEARAEKKRKKEEEERSKKSESRAAKELKKVDTSGMKKLSSFFSKAAPKKTSTG